MLLPAQDMESLLQTTEDPHEVGNHVVLGLKPRVSCSSLVGSHSSPNETKNLGKKI